MLGLIVHAQICMILYFVIKFYPNEHRDLDPITFSSINNEPNVAAPLPSAEYTLEFAWNYIFKQKSMQVNQLVLVVAISDLISDIHILNFQV